MFSLIFLFFFLLFFLPFEIEFRLAMESQAILYIKLSRVKFWLLIVKVKVSTFSIYCSRWRDEVRLWNHKTDDNDTRICNKTWLDFRGYANVIQSWFFATWITLNSCHFRQPVVAWINYFNKYYFKVKIISLLLDFCGFNAHIPVTEIWLMDVGDKNRQVEWV